MVRSPTGSRSYCAEQVGVRKLRDRGSFNAMLFNREDLDSRRIKIQKLKDLMNRDAKVISPDMTIRDAARKVRDGDLA